MTHRNAKADHSWQSVGPLENNPVQKTDFVLQFTQVTTGVQALRADIAGMQRDASDLLRGAWMLRGEMNAVAASRGVR